MKVDYCSILEKFSQQRILVIGDFILDAYYQGNCTRLAPEASVPVVDLVSKKFCLGGAANVAANLKALGCEVMFCSVIGNDIAGEKAHQLLIQTGITSRFVIADDERQTIVKTRVSSLSNTVVRFDEGTETALSKRLEKTLIDHLTQAYVESDAVILADYDKGILTPGIIEALKNLRLSDDKFIALDSKRTDFFSEIRPSLIKPNYEEAIKLLGLSYQVEKRAAQLKELGTQLFKKTKAAMIALSLDKEGAIFFEKGRYIHQCTTLKVLNPYVSGAGDTFISACVLSLLSGASLQAAAHLAVSAAGIVVKKIDTAVCSQKELTALLWEKDKVIDTIAVLKTKCEVYKMEGKRVVFTNGCFDILHSGHVSYLRKAKELGDILIVGLNTDASVKRLKGNTRPFNTLSERIAVLEALEFIDHVVPFGTEGKDTPIQLIREIRPDFFVKGEDYKNKFLPEEPALKAIGCKTVFVPYVYKQSTTQIIKKAGVFYHQTVALSN